jgi:hypothetical protein
MPVAGNKPIHWRNGLSKGAAIRHQPLWGWLGANPVANHPQTYLGPLASLALWLVGLSTLCWMMTWIHRPQRLQVLQFVAGYQTNLAVPHNVQGIRLADQLQDLVGQSLDGRIVEVENPVIVRRGTDIAEKIRQAKGKFLVLNFSMHGGVDEDGPFLIVDDADSSDAPENRIKISEILDILKKQPANQVKVVLFDAEQNETLWTFGVLDNRFGHALQLLQDKIQNVPNLLVVNACSQDQNSWIIHNLGLSNFGAQLIRCLAGSAVDSNNDGQISLGETLKSLATEVNSWSTMNRNSAQTVMILPENRDPEIILAEAIIYQAGIRPTSPPAIESPPAMSELRSAWDRYTQLASAPLSPELLCPELWCIYQKSVMRYESLLRVGDLSNSLILRDVHRQLESRIRNSLQLPLDSVTNSLRIGAIAGMDFNEIGFTEIAKLASDLLSSSEGEVVSKLNEFISKSQQNNADRMPPRILMQLAVLQESAKSPNPNGARIKFLLEQLDIPGRLLPVESQGLLLFLRDRPQGQMDNSELSLWIKSRLKAELAACGLSDSGAITQSSERGAVFYFKQIQAADAVRQLAQDRLLSTDASTRSQALNDLARAETMYSAASTSAANAAKWFNLHNQLSSSLPYYTKWVAKLGSPLNPTSDDFAEKLSGHAIAAWDNLHAAVDCKIEAVKLLGTDGNFTSALARFAEYTQKAENEFKEIEQARQKQLYSLSESDIFGEDLLIDDVLLIPGGNIDLRMRVLETRAQERVSFKGTPVSQNSFWANRPALERASNTERTGKLAIAIIGSKMFDDQTLIADATLETYDQMLERMKSFKLQLDSGFESVVKAGRQIGIRFGRFEKAAEDLVSLVPAAKPQETLSLLVRADHIGRTAGFTNFVAESKLEAGILLRRCWVNNFLVQQASRSWSEHLDNRKPAPLPYYKRAMGFALTDAGKGPAPVGLAEGLEQASRNGDLNLQVMTISEMGKRVPRTGPFQWTTEKSIDLDIELGPMMGGSLPPGQVQIQINPGAELARPEAVALQRRKIDLIANGGEAGKKSALINLLSPLVERGQDPSASVAYSTVQTQVGISALFRGQRVEVLAPINLHTTPPQINTTIPPAGKATMAMRATAEALGDSGQARGSIAIVVDCSGSMGPTSDNPGKIDQVATALENVVGRLPPGVNITVWVFGQAVGPGRTTEAPEDYIIPVLGPTVLSNDPKAVATRLAARFRTGEIVPWNKSPLIAAMAKASKGLASIGASSGPMTLLALTDGKDNRAIADLKLNPEKLPVASLVLKLFSGTGIQVKVIGFQAGEEDEATRADFETLAKLSPPGSYSSAEQLQQLINQMESSLHREFRYELETPVNLPLPNQPPDGFEAAVPGFTDRWILPAMSPGEYVLRTGSLKAPLGTIRLEPADCLLLGVAKGKPARRLGMVDDLAGRPVVRSGSWASGIAQNKSEKSAVRMLAVLEKSWDEGEVELSVVRPGMTWWEWVPLGKRTAPVRTWTEPGYPSPSWTIYSPLWPRSTTTGGPDDGSLEVWWSTEKVPRHDREFTRGADFNQITELENQSMIIDGKDCLLESVKLEDRMVTVEPGKWAMAKCLVVRTRTAPAIDNPSGLAIATIAGQNWSGQEQIVHAEAGKVASVFWPMDAKGIASIRAIQIRSLKRFKDNAVARGYHIRYERIGSPDANDERPRQVLPPAPTRSVNSGNPSRSASNP